MCVARTKNKNKNKKKKRTTKQKRLYFSVIEKEQKEIIPLVIAFARYGMQTTSVRVCV